MNIEDHGTFGIWTYQAPTDGRARYQTRTTFPMFPFWAWCVVKGDRSSSAWSYAIGDAHGGFATREDAIRAAQEATRA